jgi:hypothetical protein
VTRITPFLALLALALLVAFPAPAALAGETSVTDAPPPNGVSLELIPDAWPALPRVNGYEYNQKNHHDAPSFEGPGGSSGDAGGEGGGAPAAAARQAKRRLYRVVGVVIRCGEACPSVEAKLVNKTKGSKGDPVKVKLAPRAELIRFFAVRDDATRPLRFELLPPQGDQPLATLEKVATGGRTTANPYDARFVARELDNEQRVREGYPSHAVIVRVLSDVEKPIPRARLTLLHDQFGLLESGWTDDSGYWRGRLLAGAWTAIAFGAPQEDPSGQTVLRTPRAVYLIKGFNAAHGASVEMKADQIAKVRAVDAEGKTVALEKLTITPNKIAEAIRFADVHDRCADMFSFTLEGNVLAGSLDLLTNKGAAYDLTGTVRPGDGIIGFLHAAAFGGEGDLPLVFAPSKMARYVFDPPTGFGGGREIRARLTLLEAERQVLSVEARDLVTIYAPPGAMRLDMTYETRNGDRLAFVPRKIEGKAGVLVDCTPRPPFNLGIFAKVSRGIQIFVAITDGTGQIVQGLGSKDSGIKAFKQSGEPLFELPLTSMAFMFPTGLEKIDLKDVVLEARVRIGNEALKGRPQIEMVRRFPGHGTSAVVPRVLEANADAFLKMVAKSCEGEKRYLGGPPGPVWMDFEIFLPPGVGGMGGGGMIQLEINDLLTFVHETDRLPYAYCHELGHNVGFGHDPYMLMAPAGVEEGMYGALGFRMKNGAALQGLFRYLDGRRHEDKGTWTLGADVFNGLRLLYGPEVHRKMFEARNAYENALKVGGLSSIERIATLYTLAMNENVAWVFRAYGWPVMDFRVSWGRSIALTRAEGMKPLNADVAQITSIRRWWVANPEAPLASDAGDGDEKGAGVGGAGGVGNVAAEPSDDPRWTPVTWPTDFIALDQNGPPPTDARQHRLFARVVVPQTSIAYLVATSDVALDVRLNGHSVARLDASPQLQQPVHDELMLDKKRAFPVLMLGGENIVEIDALQVLGSKGFILGFCMTDGRDARPLPLKLRLEGPDPGEEVDEKKLKPMGPVSNSGFEDGGAWPAGWIPGPGEPGGAVVPTLDGENTGGGAKSLRMTVLKAGTGAVMQRVVVEPGAVYAVRAKIRSDKEFDGDAYVKFFVGDANTQLTRTEPMKQIGPRWLELQGKFAAQKRRVVYVCVYVKATKGVVWLDDIQMIREK